MPLRAMFMQSQAYFGSDSGIHARLMRHFRPEDVEVHVACTPAKAEPPELTAIEHLRRIPNLHLRPTNFGPSVFAQPRKEQLRRLATQSLGLVDLVGLAAYMRRHRIQIVHGTEKPRDAFFGVLLGKLTGAKSIVHLHVGYNDWITPAAKWGIRHADAVLGVSRFVAQTVIDSGVPRERVFSVVNSLDDLSRWDPRADGLAVRRELGIPDHAPTIGIMARLYYYKGHGDLLDATAILRREFPDLRVLIVGEDDPRAHPGGGSYRAELEAQTRRLGIEDNVIFTGFRLDVAELLAALDVYTMPTWEEPCAVAFIEAMAMERPVVAWHSGGTPELVVHDQTGLLVKPKDIPALAESIATLLRDPAKRRQFGVAGRQRVEQVLNPQRMCQEVLDVYRAVLGNPGGFRRGVLPAAT
jgi:glycosyltransferase involved in cell wall biosynthesis